MKGGVTVSVRPSSLSWCRARSRGRTGTESSRTTWMYRLTTALGTERLRLKEGVVVHRDPR